MIDRIQKIIDLFESGKKSKFAAKIGSYPSNIKEWLDGISNPSHHKRLKICAAYNLNPHWLDTGEGEMLAPAATPPPVIQVQQSPAANPDKFRELEIKCAQLEAENKVLREQLEKCERRLEDAYRYPPTQHLRGEIEKIGGGSIERIFPGEENVNVQSQ
jgi:hypothetical protein